MTSPKRSIRLIGTFSVGFTLNSAFLIAELPGIHHNAQIEREFESQFLGAVTMIFVIATIDLNPGTRDSFLKEFHQIVPLVHAEAGCIEYGPTIDATTDVPTQLPLRADTVTVVEKWESIEHLKAHSVAPHMAAYRPKVKDFVRSVTLQILEPA